MSLRNRNPEQLAKLMSQLYEDWKHLTTEERVRETRQTLTEVLAITAFAALDIEMSRDNVVSQDAGAQGFGDIIDAIARDLMASGALNLTAKLDSLLDKLEARAELVAKENFGDERTRHCRVALEHLSIVVVDILEEAEREGTRELMRAAIRARVGFPPRQGYDYLFSATLMKLEKERVTTRVIRQERDCWRLA